jgi:5-methylthioadenosine/S-adenosylhomocysteine deaminase
MALVLTGTVVTFDPAQPVIGDGAVYLGDDGHIAKVARRQDPGPAGFNGARTIDTDAYIYPGLIDLHSHLGYNTLPLWEAPRTPYAHHDRWPDEDHPPDYATTISWPAKVFGQAAAEALIKYVEVKALIGGTTAIQGAPHTTRPVNGWLLRIVDIERLPAGKDLVMCSALQKDVDALRKLAPKLGDGQVLIYHVAEGVPGTPVHGEFDDLDTGGCLHPGLIGVHATALADADFVHWQHKVHDVDPHADGTIVWSPFSNLWLYHRTTDVLGAAARGIRIALGSDWSPSGTKSVLGELKVADALNTNTFNNHFGDDELCAMVTANPGDALAVAWGPQVGRLQDGAAADVLVCEHHDADPFRNLIEATERHVRLVLVRGRAHYGTPALMKAAGATDVDTVTVDGKRRALAIRQPGKSDATLNWRGVRAALQKVRADPQKAWQSSLDGLAAWGGPLDDPEAPLALIGDMPEGDVGLLAAGGEIPVDLELPRPDALTHDDDFFAAVSRSGPPELQALKSYYAA